MGVDRSTFLISKKFEIKGFWTNVKVKGHVEEVIDTIKVLNNYEQHYDLYLIVCSYIIINYNKTFK